MMSPTPPLPNQVNAVSDGTMKLQPNFINSGLNHSQQIANPQYSGMALCNGHTENMETQGMKVKKSPACERKLLNGTVKKRGRPPKVKSEGGCGAAPPKQSKITDTMKKTKRTVNRFKDVTKEELMDRLLPDRIKHNLDILIIGINPGLFAAYKGHHYAGPGNHFWACINMSGFVDKKMTSDDDMELLDYGIGFSTIVPRTTPGSKDLSNKEIREGAKKLIEKIQFYKPRIAVFNGKGIYEIFSKEIFGQKKKDFTFGTQEKRIPDTETRIFVMPSSSARCAQFPRAQDKVHFYIKMKQLRDDLIGDQAMKEDVQEVAYDFDLEKAKEIAKIQNIKQEKYDPGYDVANTSFPQYTPNHAEVAVPGTSGLQGTSGAIKTNTNNNSALETRNFSDAPKTTNNNNNAGMNLNGLESDQNSLTDVTEKHKHLVQYLRQDAEPGPSNITPKSRALPLSLSPTNPRLQQDVSDEQRQERVGNWVREQLVQEYDSDLPMGMDGNNDNRSAGTENGAAGAGAVELDRASQLSAISAGVSGSASESTSGYGSVDASSRRVHLDRVEMWVMDQQHVRRHNHQQQQLQQSIQAAVCVNQQQNQQPPSSRPEAPQSLYQNPTSVSWQQVPTFMVAYPMSTFGMLNTPNCTVTTTNQLSSMSAATRKATTSANGGATLTQPHSSSADRSSPYSFLRAGARRDGGSGSSFGAAVRPPVPLYSSWGGEGSGSGGSGLSSPAMFNPNSGPLLQTSNDNNNNSSMAGQSFPHNGFGLGPLPMGGTNILSPNSNM